MEEESMPSRVLKAREMILAVVLLGIAPFVTATFFCVCFPLVLPFGFVAFASAPPAFELVRGDTMLKYGTFYMLWWLLGPLLVCITAFLTLVTATRDLALEAPKGLLLVSVSIPTLITPLWWGLIWFASFPLAVSTLCMCKWFVGDPRIRQLLDSFTSWLKSEDVKRVMLRMSNKIALFRDWILSLSGTTSGNKSAMKLGRRRPGGTGFDSSPRHKKRMRKRNSSTQSIAQQVAIRALEVVPGLGWLLFFYRTVTSRTSIGSHFQRWKKDMQNEPKNGPRNQTQVRESPSGEQTREGDCFPPNRQLVVATNNSLESSPVINVSSQEPVPIRLEFGATDDQVNVVNSDVERAVVPETTIVPTHSNTDDDDARFIQHRTNVDGNEDSGFHTPEAITRETSVQSCSTDAGIPTREGAEYGSEFDDSGDDRWETAMTTPVVYCKK